MADRPDLAAMLAPFLRMLAAAEAPILERNGLTMWGYAVLLGLRAEPMRTQAALAEAIGADKTRVIEVLDLLQDDGLITRERDPADRRARLVALTAKGRRVRDSTQRAIQRFEEQQVLSALPPADRSRFVRSLQTLSDEAADRTH